jgi:hypothetical protein
MLVILKFTNFRNDLGDCKSRGSINKGIGFGGFFDLTIP